MYWQTCQRQTEKVLRDGGNIIIRCVVRDGWNCHSYSKLKLHVKGNSQIHLKRRGTMLVLTRNLWYKILGYMLMHYWSFWKLWIQLVWKGIELCAPCFGPLRWARDAWYVWYHRFAVRVNNKLIKKIPISWISWF